MRIGILLLAAGESKRLGQPKQLLPFGNHTLLRHAAETALTARLGPVFVVLGAHEAACRQALIGAGVTIFVNPDFREGMGTSIAVGIQQMQGCPLDGVIISLCDLPHLQPENYRQLFDEHERTGASIVAARSGEAAGAPALFTARHFPKLANLTGAVGARSLIAEQSDVVTIACPEAGIDLDTPADLARLAHLPSVAPQIG